MPLSCMQVVYYFNSIPLPRRKTPVKIEEPIDNCRCVNCDVAKKEATRGSRSKTKIICDSELR